MQVGDSGKILPRGDEDTVTQLREVQGQQGGRGYLGTF